MVNSLGGSLVRWQVLIALLFLGAIVSTERRKQRSSLLKSKPYPAAEAEDVFTTKPLGNEQSTAAQLHLARAYMNMKNHESARKVLNNIVKNGSLEDQQQARECLEKLDQNNQV